MPAPVRFSWWGQLRGLAASSGLQGFGDVSCSLKTAEIWPACLFIPFDVFEVGPAEVRVAEVGPVGEFIGPAEIGLAEVGKAEVCTAKVSFAKNSSAEVGREELGPAEVGPAEVGPAEVGPAEGDGEA